MATRWLVPLLLVAAPMSFLFSLSEVTARAVPQLAATLYPANAGAHEQQAKALFQAAAIRAGDVATQPPQPALEAARAAYERSPAVPEALYILARDESRRDKSAALRILQETNRLSRRSTAVSFALLAAYGDRRNETAGLQVLDQLLRRETVLHGQLLEVMTGLVANPAMHRPILQLLRARPPWAPQFWRQLAQSATGLSGAAQLRLQAQGTGATFQPELDRLLVEGLAGQQRFDEAYRLASTLSGAEVRRAGLVLNPDFRASDAVLPFGWRLFNEGDRGAASDTPRGGLAIDALAGARGTVAEQLVRLPSGPVRLSVAASSENSMDHLLLQLACVQGQERVLFESPASRLPAMIDPDGCNWAMLRIRVAVPSDAQAGDWSIRRVSLDLAS